MADIKVVIGANFGDEGKGLMTDYFCYKAEGKTLVVCSNGGAQRGHTVSTKKGERHVFHHFGSGTFAGSDTYLCEYYILNPIMFRDEFSELKELGYNPKVYVHTKCTWTTPFDMIINQLVEAHRGENRHGSCGMGIWETVVRNRKSYKSITEVKGMKHKELVQFLEKIRDGYLHSRLAELGVNFIPEEWKEIIYSRELIDRYVDDLQFMLNHIELTDNNVLYEYEHIIFENGQGLLLDQNIKGYGEHTTPSNTGIANVKAVLDSISIPYELEVCYVTRTYLTRHGAGRFDSECDKEEINSEIVDETNVSNPHQGNIRYGKINVYELLERIKKDFAICGKGRMSLAITHLNETDDKFVANEEIKVEAVERLECNIYYSDGICRESITKKEGSC